MFAGTATLSAHPGIRALLLVIVFVSMAKAYSIAGRLVMRRVGTTKLGRNLAPAIVGAGLGLWAIVVWVVFS